MHSVRKMQPTATDGVAWSVGLSVGHVSDPAKTTEPIEMPFGADSVWPKEHVFNGGSDPHGKEQFWGSSGPFKSIESYYWAYTAENNNNNTVVILLKCAAQMTLQSFIDKLFESIFTAGNGLPPAVKYLFDLFDLAAVQHGLTDPEVVHSWKSNRSVSFTQTDRQTDANRNTSTASWANYCDHRVSVCPSVCPLAYL